MSREQVIYAVGDELAGSSELFVALDAVEDFCIIAVLCGENIDEVIDIGFTVAGLLGWIVDRADLDGIGGRRGSLLSAGGQSKNNHQRQQQSNQFTHSIFLFLIVFCFIRTFPNFITIYCIFVRKMAMIIHENPRFLSSFAIAGFLIKSVGNSKVRYGAFFEIPTNCRTFSGLFMPAFG